MWTNKQRLNMSALSRRSFLDSAAGGISGAALAFLAMQDMDLHAESMIPGTTDLLPASDGLRRSFDNQPRDTHHAPKAKAVIQLFMNGGPAHMDLFEPKPILDKHHGEPYFNEIAEDISSPQDAGGLLKSPFKFKQHGDSGAWVSNALPELAKVVDNVSFIKSMYNNHPNHEPALFKIHSGRLLPGRPGLGAWVTYGLGSVNQNLPAYVVLDDPAGLPVNTVQSWQNGFLPPVYQGTRVRSEGAPILNERGQRTWVKLESLETEVGVDDFDQVGEAFEASGPDPADFYKGEIARATVRLIRAKALVDFAVGWFETHRAKENAGESS